MEFLPQIVKLMEVLSFLVEKLPSDLKTKDKYEEYLKVVTQILDGCSDDSPIENITVKEYFIYLFLELNQKEFPIRIDMFLTL